MTAVVTDPAALTPDWLSAALGGIVTDVRVERVGTGQIGTCHRLHLTGEGVPATLLAKLPAEDPAARRLLAGAYRSELRFYTELAATVAVRAPATSYAAIDDDGTGFVLLLEDLAPAEQGDQLAGCSPARATDAVTNLAGLHGPRWCDPSLLEIAGLSITGPEDAALMAEFYGQATEALIEALGDLLMPEDPDTLRACVPVSERWALARADRFGLVHGDYRLDNLLFPPGDAVGVTAVDWQTLSLGLPARDLAYFLSTSLGTHDRRTHERELVAAYHSALASYGVDDYWFEECWSDYRFAMLQGPLVAAFGLAYGTRTARGDRMFAAMVSRSCAAIRDLDTLGCI